MSAALQPTFHHPDDSAVDRFAAAMKKKLAESREIGRSGWDNEAMCPAQRLRTMLREHIDKGDPVDVGNFAMMLFNRGEPTIVRRPMSAIFTAAKAGGNTLSDTALEQIFDAFMREANADPALPAEGMERVTAYDYFMRGWLAGVRVSNPYQGDRAGLRDFINDFCNSNPELIACAEAAWNRCMERNGLANSALLPLIPK